MKTARYFAFGPFYLDVFDERLWTHEASVPLGHKAFAVLAQLVSHPGQLVTKDDLLASVWPHAAVSEAVLTTAMREIRVAVGDTPRTPQFVQTVHGRGYRFIAPVVETRDGPSARTAPIGAAAGIVGREAEWARLCEWFAAIQEGSRRIGFIAGEAGIGKTALVEAFVAGITSTNVVRIGRGQCIEQYGAGEAYLPILEALGRLGRDPDVFLAPVLQDYAPSWLAHLPSLTTDRAEPTAPVAPERMLRELTEALEALTVADPLVLVLEDLHWCDSATLQWLGYAARRRDSARLLVLGTYRPVELLLHKTPLRDVLAELRHQAQTAEIVLDYLSRDAVQSYVRQRCGGIPALDSLVEVLYRRTGGHPLFLAGIIDELIQLRGMERADLSDLDLQAMAHTIPVNVRQFIEHRFEQLSEEDQAILEAASVAGDPFSVAAVVAGTSLSEDRIESRCAEWTRAHRLLMADGIAAWPDGTVSARYQFRHALFHEAAYARMSPERRARFHQLIGSRLEAAYAKHASSIAAELAVHFEQGRNLWKAVSYLETAARNAVHRSAYLEAHGHLVRALRMVELLPDGRDRMHREVALFLLLAQVLETTRGWGAEDVARAYSRARELCIALRDGPRLLQATWGLIAVSIVRGELLKTQDLARDVLRLAKKRRNSLFRMAAHAELGGTALALGQTSSARRHFHLADALYDPRQHRSGLAAFGMDLGIFARIWATHLTWHQGYPERARNSAEQTMRVAAEIGHPFTATITLAYAAMLSQLLRDVPEVDRLTHATIAHASEHGFPYYLAWAEVLRGWSLAAQGAGESAVAQIRDGIEVLQSTARLRLPYYRALLAEACGRIGRLDEGLLVVSEAFEDIRRTEERWWEADLHRTRGELLRLAAMDTEAEKCFRAAIDVAREQRAKMLELRAIVSLTRLCQGTNSRKEAHGLLAQAYGWFTEGFETHDVRDARSLIEELAPRAGRASRPIAVSSRRHE
jgi:DNA-binding winged helix-turn-helix (wHTH) protein/tetratricopeptide (TPR) repeat protein